MAFQTHGLASGLVPCLVQENIPVRLFITLLLLKTSTNFSYHLSDILLVCILYCCSNKVWWLRTTGIYPRTLLEIQSPKPISLSLSQGVSEAPLPLEDLFQFLGTVCIYQLVVSFRLQVSNGWLSLGHILPLSLSCFPISLTRSLMVPWSPPRFWGLGHDFVYQISAPIFCFHQLPPIRKGIPSSP